PREGLTPSLAERFPLILADDGVLSPGDRIVVAISGGVDSSVLLHLLRFSRTLPGFDLLAAHFDHRMRPDSRRDLQWVTGLCRAWDVPLRTGTAQGTPVSEEDARNRRYTFLLGLKDREKASWVLTGHQAEDQVETVLFRVFRGTGLRGLAGIPRQRSPGVYRPLLEVSRREVLAYAAHMGIGFLEDPSNESLAPARNRIRNQVLPELERGPAPGIKRSLRRLARLASENEDAWESLLPGLLEGVLQEEADKVFVVRPALLAYDPAVQTRLMRKILAQRGIELDEVGTRALMEFTRTGASGRVFSLPGGASLSRDFGRFSLDLSGSAETGTRLDQEATAQPSGALLIPEPGSGTEGITLEGRSFQVGWSPAEPAGYEELLEIPISDVAFPLTLRGWLPGDRIRMDFGTKKLKKLFGEAKVPQKDRGKIPVLVDAEGDVLWVAGFASSTMVKPRAGSGVLFLGIRNVDSN
ncbi:MAG: tRNA lysidine(34) synthetase TilS, partial [Gemmatimonadetes bacterium]|nr:tRNA lysidine(34) synthetase TilS [Gemmatimonadota bacterium]